MKWLALVLTFVFSQLHAAEVVDVAHDPRFDAAVSEVGSTKPAEFKFFGVYMAEPVDVSKEVVLFVHGASGSPRDFADLAQKLDSNNQQAWYAYYASGDAVAASGSRLAEEVRRLLDDAGVQRIRVVAHSMGGLVAWHLVKSLEQHMHVEQFVTVATPWGGHWGAGIGSMMSFLTPCRDSWHDLSPGSRTLQAIYDGQLETNFTLVYALSEDSDKADGDGTISRQSQLAPGMRFQAEHVVRTVATHQTVLTGKPAARIASLLRDKA
jgi:pimeloyl-ACP methyl ester carboxylesterase